MKFTRLCMFGYFWKTVGVTLHRSVDGNGSAFSIRNSGMSTRQAGGRGRSVVDYECSRAAAARGGRANDFLGGLAFFGRSNLPAGRYSHSVCRFMLEVCSVKLSWRVFDVSMELPSFLMFIGGYSNVVDFICVLSFRRERRHLLFSNREVASRSADGSG